MTDPKLDGINAELNQLEWDDGTDTDPTPAERAMQVRQQIDFDGARSPVLRLMIFIEADELIASAITDAVKAEQERCAKLDPRDVRCPHCWSEAGGCCFDIRTPCLPHDQRWRAAIRTPIPKPVVALAPVPDDE